MSANDIKDFIYENYYKQNRFSKEDSYCSLNQSQKKGFAVVWEKINRNST